MFKPKSAVCLLSYLLFQGSCVAMTLVIPLDTVRTRMILDETKKSKKITEVFIEILKEEGP